MIIIKMSKITTQADKNHHVETGCIKLGILKLSTLGLNYE